MNRKFTFKNVVRRVSTIQNLRTTGGLAHLRNRSDTLSETRSSVGDEEVNKGPTVVYENTFQLAPKDSQKFPTKKAEDILKNTFLTHLLDAKYNGETCNKLTIQITESVKTQVKAELGSNNRFKIVVLVIIGANYGQGARVASRCLWYPQYDRFAQYEYHNESLFAVGVVYGVYYE